MLLQLASSLTAFVLWKPYNALAEELLAPSLEPVTGTPEPVSGNGTALPTALQLEQYINTAQGYSVAYPSGWEKKDKAGADVLIEDPSRRSTSLGVTVNPVRVTDISSFGSLQAVGEKLLEAERKKESTLSATLVSQTSRTSLPSGATLYCYEYDLDSTRGHKRVMNTVTIFRSKLYILNAMYKCEKTDKTCSREAALETINTLRTLSNSFTIV